MINQNSVLGQSLLCSLLQHKTPGEHLVNVRGEKRDKIHGEVRGTGSQV